MKLSNSGATINAVESIRPAAGATSTPQTTCVLAHGLGSGLGFFFPNLAYLASRFDRVVAFDWLGFAGSDRPEWDATASAQDATNFFTDSFTLFCDEMEIDRFTFIAHSMGGLLASEFALVCSRQTLDALILISPAGIPPRPEPQDVLDGSDLSGGLRLVKAAWEHNLTPGGFLRATGPKGPEYCQSMLSRRFATAHWSNDELLKLMADYLYHCSAQPGSGEYAMNALMVPEFHRSHGAGIYARRPLLPRIFSDGGLPSDLPVHIMFGDNDWLYSKATRHALKSAMTSSVNQEKNVSLQIAPHAGHHIYIDNPDAVHNAIDNIFCMVHGMGSKSTSAAN